MKQLWEYSIEELTEEISTTKAILAAGGHNHVIADRLAALQEHFDERLIERRYGA